MSAIRKCRLEVDRLLLAGSRRTMSDGALRLLVTASGGTRFHKAAMETNESGRLAVAELHVFTEDY